MKTSKNPAFMMYLISKKSDLVHLGALVEKQEGIFELHNCMTIEQLEVLGHLQEGDKIENQYFLLKPLTIEGICQESHFEVTSKKTGELFRGIGFRSIKDLQCKNASIQ